jgi:hypothetical protein
MELVHLRAYHEFTSFLAIFAISNIFTVANVPKPSLSTFPLRQALTRSRDITMRMLCEDVNKTYRKYFQSVVLKFCGVYIVINGYH